MTNEEKLIIESLGKESPFRVPEGYFDRFADQFMDKLPEQQPAAPAQRPRLKVLRPILTAAACLCVAIFSITLYLNRPQDVTEQAPVAATATNVAEETLMDEAADYAMLDNADIYACLSE